MNLHCKLSLHIGLVAALIAPPVAATDPNDRVGSALDKAMGSPSSSTAKKTSNYSSTGDPLDRALNRALGEPAQERAVGGGNRLDSALQIAGQKSKSRDATIKARYADVEALRESLGGACACYLERKNCSPTLANTDWAYDSIAQGELDKAWNSNRQQCIGWTDIVERNLREANMSTTLAPKRLALLDETTQILEKNHSDISNREIQLEMTRMASLNRKADAEARRRQEDARKAEKARKQEGLDKELQRERERYAREERARQVDLENYNRQVMQDIQGIQDDFRSFTEQQNREIERTGRIIAQGNSQSSLEDSRNGGSSSNRSLSRGGRTSSSSSGSSTTGVARDALRQTFVPSTQDMQALCERHARTAVQKNGQWQCEAKQHVVVITNRTQPLCYDPTGKTCNTGDPYYGGTKGQDRGDANIAQSGGNGGAPTQPASKSFVRKEAITYCWSKDFPDGRRWKCHGPASKTEVFEVDFKQLSTLMLSDCNRNRTSVPRHLPEAWIYYCGRPLEPYDYNVLETYKLQSIAAIKTYRCPSNTGSRGCTSD